MPGSHEQASQDLEKLLQQNLHTKHRKQGEEHIDIKLAQMNKQLSLSDPFVNYIIHHESKY